MKWLRAFGLLLLWQFMRMRNELPILIVIQVALATGIVYGMSFLIPDIDERSALFLATGAPTIGLLILGLTVVPQEVTRGRLTGMTEYISTLPVPRLAPPAAEIVFWILAQLPGTVISLVVATMRFGFEVHPKLVIAPVVFIVAFTGAAVGYALAMTLKPQVAQQMASFLAIGVLLFSPINFPAERLPEALQAIHRVLPVKYMADLMRWGFTGGPAPDVSLAFTVVGAWCLLGILLSWRVALRRK
ncbi:MAG: ABC transporter permease [Actinomycetota bacterium]